MREGEAFFTRRAGVSVPSTSKRTIVFFSGRDSREAIMLPASA